MSSIPWRTIKSNAACVTLAATCMNVPRIGVCLLDGQARLLGSNGSMPAQGVPMFILNSQK